MAHEEVNKPIFIYGFVTGYARNAIYIEDIAQTDFCLFC